MVREYMRVALLRPYWGYGDHTWPELVGMKSIDNQYLWLLLQHGFFALAFYIILMMWVMTRLFLRGMFNSPKYKTDTSLSFALLGCLVTIALTFFIVYMGMQTEPLLYMMLGWGEGLALSKPAEVAKDPIIREKKPKEIAAFT